MSLGLLKYIFISILHFFINPKIFADSFDYNLYNNGSVGLINTPSEFYDESVHGVTFDGTPDQKITLTSSHMIGLRHHFFIPISKDYLIQGLNIKTTKIRALI